MEISKETLSLIENLRDDADALQKKSNEAFHLLKNIAMNERIVDGIGVRVGDFFEDKNGEVGVFLGCKGGLPAYGSLITKGHCGYVYPVKRLSYKQAIERIFMRINDLI